MEEEAPPLPPPGGIWSASGSTTEKKEGVGLHFPEDEGEEEEEQEGVEREIDSDGLTPRGDSPQTGAASWTRRTRLASGDSSATGPCPHVHVHVIRPGPCRMCMHGVGHGILRVRLLRASS